MNMLSIGVTSSGSVSDVRGECYFEDGSGGSGGRMIGAMPAVAVRHERRRQEKRTKRPSMLYLQSPQSRSATPSPLQSPPPCHQPPPPEIYVCGKVSVLHVVVVSLLLGAVLLIVGLVQLKPGADASQHRYLLLGSGSFLLLLGVVLAIIRCCVLPWAAKRHAPVIPEAPPHAPSSATLAAPDRSPAALDLPTPVEPAAST